MVSPMMKTHLSGTGLVAMLLFFVAQPAAAKKENPLERVTPVPADQAIPVVDFFRPWLLTSPKLNPAGTHFGALVSTQDDRTDLMVYELATKKVERLSGGDRNDIYSYEWLTDKRLVYQVAQDKQYANGIFAAELGKFEDSYALMRHSVVVPVGFPQSDPLQMTVWVRNSFETARGTDGGVIKIDTRHIATADGRMNVRTNADETKLKIHKLYPTPAGGEAIAYVADKAGELAFAVTVLDGVLTLHRYDDEKWQRCPIDLEKFSIAGAGDVTGELLVHARNTEGKPAALHRIDTATGVLGDRLFLDEKYDAIGARLYRHPVDRRVLGVRYNRKGPQTVWFDGSYAAVQKTLEKALPKESVELLGSDRGQKRFFIRASSDVRTPVYYMFNLETQELMPVVEGAPWIDSKRMRPMRSITYTARDGREMEGYVTLPAEASKENPAPLVVLPHGGPWARDNWGWNAQVQFLASRGYAVFQPNYRGSTGYEWRFPEEDMWAFRKMHDDVTDGVNAVVKTGLVDRQRIAIMGGSFGGYLALSGAAHEKELYRCAITIAGVFDWERVMKDAEKNSESARGLLGRLRLKLGDPKRNQERFEEISPIKHVEKIKVPVFVAHGTQDLVATVAQSKKLIAEFKKHGVTYEKQIEPDEGHGFRYLENEIELYSRIEAFLAKHLAPKTSGT